MNLIGNYIRSKLDQFRQSAINSAQNFNRPITAPHGSTRASIPKPIQTYFNKPITVPHGRSANIPVLTQLGQGFVGGSTFGLTNSQPIKPVSIPQKIAYGAGFIGGAINPLNPVNKIGAFAKIGSIGERAVAPLVGKIAQPLIKKGVSTIGSELAQTAAYGGAARLVGQHFDPKSGLAMGLVGRGVFGAANRAMGKGFTTKAMHPEDMQAVRDIVDIFRKDQAYALKHYGKDLYRLGGRYLDNPSVVGRMKPQEVIDALIERHNTDLQYPSLGIVEKPSPKLTPEQLKAKAKLPGILKSTNRRVAEGGKPDPFLVSMEKYKAKVEKTMKEGKAEYNGEKPPPDGYYTGSSANQEAGAAQFNASERKQVFDKIFSKIVGKGNVAKTTGTQTAIKFKDIPESIAEEVIKYRENPTLKASPEVKAWSAKLGVEYDRLFKYAKEKGVDMNYLKNYITHIWKESIPEVEMKYRAYKQKFKFAIERTVPTYEEGIKMGLTPMYTHPAEILQHYSTNLEKTIANVETFNELRKEKFIVPASVGVGRPGFEPVDAPGFPRSISKNGQDHTIVGNWYAPSSIAKQLNNYFSPQQSNEVLSVARKVSGGLQDIGLSGGIPKTPMNAFTIANATKEALAGRVTSPLTSFIRSMSGKASKKFFMDNIETVKKMQERNIGLNTEFEVGNMIDRGVIKNTFGNGIGSAWDHIVNEPTFKRFMPMLQVNLFKDIEKQSLKSGKNSAEAADIAAQAVKNFYGVIGTDKEALQGAVLKDIKGTVFFAPKFREAMINFWAKNVAALRHPLALENRSNVKFVAGAIATYIAYDKLNQHFTGKHLKDNPPGTEDKLLIPVGNGQVIGVPYLSSIATLPRAVYREGKMLASGDFKGAVKDAGQTYASMLVKPAMDVAANSDYFGKPITQDNMTTGQKFGAIAKYLGSAYLSHPYLKELFDSRNQNDPAYQRLSRAMELPLRFYTQSNLDSKYYFGAKDKAVKGLSAQEQSALNSIPLYDKEDPNDPNSRIMKYQIYLTYPNVFKAKQQTELETAAKTGKAIDPLYLVDYETAKKYMRYEALPEGSQDRKDLTKAYPELVALFDIRGKYFDENPIPGATPSQRPIASAYVQQQMDNKNWKDPQVKAYLDANTTWNNSQREKLGLLPISTGGYGFSPKSKLLSSLKKKVRVKKVKGTKKLAFKKGKKLKAIKVKPIKLMARKKTFKPIKFKMA